MATKLTPEQEIELLKKQLADKEANEADLKQQLEEKDANEAALIQALKNAEAGKGNALPVVDHDGTQYQVLAAKAEIKRKSYTAAEIANSPDLIAYLVEIGSGLLQEIKSEEVESND